MYFSCTVLPLSCNPLVLVVAGDGCMREYRASNGREGSMAAVRRLYLSLYNSVLFVGWSRILYSAVGAVLENGPSGVYPAVEKDLQIWQTAALLEILNSILGIVRSPVSATLPQIASRIFVTWGILWSFPETRGHWLVVSLILSWGLTEVIRYLFFALKEAFGLTPAALVWLRYSTFIVLYPTGILSEAGLIYVALPYIKASDLYSLRMPNKFNFAFDYYWASIYALACYLPGAPHMYLYMVGQRRKTLSKAKSEVGLKAA